MENKLKILLEREKLLKEICRELNNFTDLKSVLTTVVKYIKKLTNCEAIAIRLHDKGDYPYYVWNGFQEDFIIKENSLCIKDKNGHCIKEPNSDQYLLECMCGNIIRKRYNSSFDFFTENGSFWSNNTSVLLASTSAKERQSNTRNECNSCGYESVALIPIKTNDENIGLIQLNDKRLNVFTLELIQYIEMLGSQIGSAVKNSLFYQQLLNSNRELKLLKEKYKKEKNLAETIINTSQVIILSLDRKGNIQSFNKYMENLSGYSLKEVKGKNWFDLFLASDEKEKMKQIFMKAINNIHTVANRNEIIIKNGKKKIIEWYDDTLKDNSEKIIGVLAIGIDITERNKLQEQLINSEKQSAVGQLAAGIAHEFNNILAINSVNAQLIELDHKNIHCEKVNETLKGIKNILASIQRGKDIAKNMMVFAKPTTPKKEFAYFSDIIDEVLKIQKHQFELENIKIEKNYSCTRKSKLDIGQMHQVFLNLILNARHAIKIKGSGTIKIKITENSKQKCIRVIDDGIGIKKDNLKNIFNPFFTTKGAHADNNLQIQGSGLGLSVSYQIIQQHNGKIEVKSEKNKYTAFKICVPFNQDVTELDIKNKTQKEETINKKDIKILLIDDETTFVETIKELFEKLGFSFIDFSYSGKDAIKKVKQNQYDVIFLDLLLPVMNGKEIFKIIKSHDKNVKVIFMSGQIGINHDEILKDCNAYEYIEKPFDLNEIIKTLNKISSEK
jgi:PAS domain S-box-containing protein